MTEKRKKPEQLAEVWQWLKEIDAAEQKQRQAYEDLVNSIQGLQPLEKAEAWLSYVADDIEYWGDQEALVYLKSRGRDCSAQINKLVSVWKTAVLCGKLMMQLPSRRLEEPFEATGQIRY